MQTHTIPRVIAAGAVLVAAALVLLTRNPNGEPPTFVLPGDTALPALEDASVADAGTDLPVQSDDALAAAKIRELEAMSETFRNTTFLIAIRDAGFVCRELLRVSGGLDDSPKWLATCSETLSYTVGVASNGGLRVEPFLQYFDGVQWPVQIEQSTDPIQVPSGRPLRDSLPPETR